MIPCKTYTLLAMGATLLASQSALTSQAKNYTLKSPSGRLSAVVDAGGSGTDWSLKFEGKALMLPTPIGLRIEDREEIGAGKVSKVERGRNRGRINVVVGKQRTLSDDYNSMTLTYGKGEYALEVRAYDEGVAYRWKTMLPDSVTVVTEHTGARFDKTPEVWLGECDTVTYDERDHDGTMRPIHQGYRNFERLYKVYPSPDSISEGVFGVTPTLFAWPGGDVKMVIAESDVYDYPALYLTPGGNGDVKGHWAAYPRKVIDADPVANPYNWYSTHLVYEREPYIARTGGERTYPWRVYIVSDDDRQLLTNQLIYKLAPECRLADTSWIKPGRSAWEWWHKAVLDGVDFESGNHNLSPQLYKYYIDWASRNGIEYMTLDAGWSESYIEELCEYARLRGVGIIVWTWASCPLDAPDDWIARMKRYGVAGAKIDFFERNDQVAMRWQRKLAEKLAANNMVVLFHGCPVPSGLERTYPNVLNYEAVRGAECNFWEPTLTARHHATFPFIRSLAGPEDYTPGSMRSVTAAEFRPVDRDNTPPMSMGTRAHEMALFLTCDMWLATICDSPTQYDSHPEILEYLSTVPSAYDETVALEGRLGEYITTARRKGADWWVGGITDNSRETEIDTRFLEPGASYEAFIICDAADSESEPKHCDVLRHTVRGGDTIPVRLASSGGFVMRLRKI